jgi:hypothetical protein
MLELGRKVGERHAMIGTLAMAMAFILAAYPSTAVPGCFRQGDWAVCLMSPAAPVVAGWEVADMLCCCKTYSGGECCTEAAKCGGKPPGCFCASPSVPAPKKAKKPSAAKKPSEAPEGKLAEF